jgi:hypothetical protein
MGRQWEFGTQFETLWIGSPAAHVSISVDRGVIRPGDDLKVHVVVKNGPAQLEARALLLEIEGVESIDLPRHANMNQVIHDFTASTTAKPGAPPPQQPSSTTNSATTFEAKITIGAGLSFEPGQERKFDGRVRLPKNVQPTYEGKYVKHFYRFRARLDVFGTDPDSGWMALRVLSE